MRILAIDPGNFDSAYMLFDEKPIMFGKIPNNEMLKLVDDGLLVDVDYVVIEMIACYGMAVGKTVFNTCVWIGRFMQTALDLGVDVRIAYRKDIKLHLCGATKAKDSNIRQALIDKYGEAGTKKSPGATYGISKDVWAALAVADYALAVGQENLPTL